MTMFYAQPYDVSATGFYFETIEEYKTKSANLKNDYDQSVEEFEIQFIDGETIDAQLFEALGVQQANINAFLSDIIDGWDDDQKIKAIIAVGEAGYRFDLEKDNSDDFEIDLYEMNSLRDLAMYFVDEGIYGEIPNSLQFYIDYDLMARDLGMEYSEITIDSVNYVYRCW